MLNTNDILESIRMISDENLDVRTVTMGISLFDCCDPDPKVACRKIVDKICSKAEHLVRTGEEIEKEYGNPIINKKTKKPETAPVWRVYKDQKKAKAAAAQKAERKAAREAAETESKAA